MIMQNGLVIIKVNFNVQRKENVARENCRCVRHRIEKQRFNIEMIFNSGDGNILECLLSNKY